MNSRSLPLTAAELADLCLKALADLGGTSTAPEIREHLVAQGIIVHPAYLASVLNSLARRDPAPLNVSGDARGARRRRRWRLAGVPAGPEENEVLSREQSAAFGRNARAVRKAAGRKQTDVAGEAGIAQSTLSFLENGIGRVPVKRAEDLALALGTTIEVLTADGGAA